MTDMIQSPHDSKPGQRTIVVLLLLYAAGLVMIGLGYRTVARNLAAPLQMPALVSGCMVGLGLVITSLSLLIVHVGRIAAERERRQIDELTEWLRTDSHGGTGEGLGRVDG